MVSREAIIAGVITGLATAIATAWLRADAPSGSPAGKLLGWFQDRTNDVGITEGVPRMQASEVTLDG